MKKLLFIFLMFATLVSCTGLRMGGGVKGEVIDEDTIVLDGDTFKIQERINDSLFVVWNYEHSNDKKPYYLLKYERNGFYYPQIGAASITSIDNTTNYVSIDDKEVYDINNKKVLFSSPCCASGLYYLGKWRDLQLFASSDTICFSDGICLGLQKNVFCRKSKKDGVVTFVDGAQIKDVSFCDLYNAKKISTTTDTSLERLVKDYYVKPRSEYEMVEAGISVDLDIPKGDTDSDKAIRKWMISAIRDDAFFLLENNKDIPVGKCTSLNDMLHSLDEYGVLWEKLCRAENQIEDTLDVRMTCDIRVKKVADCEDYTTYHYWASLYNGGLHELPREYYITYDKRRGGLLDVNNSVKPSMLQHFRHLVLESLKKEYDFFNEQESSWEDFTHLVFSFHCPVIGIEDENNFIPSLLDHNYSCDEWAGLNGYNEKAFTENDFPLTHFAVLPEGIVLTYHPYQIDCFVAGEYHGVIPFKDANKCLLFDYSKHEDLKAKLQRFIK